MQNWVHHFYFFIFVLWILDRYQPSIMPTKFLKKTNTLILKSETPISMANFTFQNAHLLPMPD
jgi:hypothetical protein